MKAMTARVEVLVAALAIALEGVASCVVVLLNDPLWLAGGGCMHVIAAFLARFAAGRRRRDLSRVERDLVLWTALLVPVFGPCLAWALPRPPGQAEEANAHAVFEQYSDHVQPSLPDYERTLFTGDYAKDLARELDAESYHEVLRHGSTDQKRNALRRLAELGQPQHFALIRGCLLDPEHEVRLYAYSELERAGRVYEEEIARRSKELERKPDDPEPRLGLARNYYSYAASGVHDENMAAFYFRSAERYAEEASGLQPGEPEPCWLRACALGQLGEYDAAHAALAAMPAAQQELPRSCIIRAELAFRRRDFAAARAEAARLSGSEAGMPDWLKALEVKS